MSGVSNRPSSHVHKLVHQTAVEMAHQLYDHMMMDNRWYEQWKRANPGLSSRGLADRFVAKNLSKMVPQARATLAGMLRTCSDESIKEDIYEALLLDRTLIRGRGN